MNYITEIRAFYDWLDTNRLAPSAISLWHALMSIANAARWPVDFSVALSTLSSKTGCGKDAIYTARNALRQKGLISYRERSGKQSTIYQLHSLVSENPTQTPIQTPTQTPTLPPTQTPTQTPNNNKQNETKQDITVAAAEGGPQTGCIAPFSPDALMLCEYFEQNCHKLRSLALLNAFQSCIDGGIANEVMCAAIDEVALRGIEASGKYLTRILESLKAEKITTLSEYQARNQAHQLRTAQRGGKPTVADKMYLSEPDKPLEDWEKQWLEEKRRNIERRRQREGGVSHSEIS